MINWLTKIDIEGSQSVCYHQEIDSKNFFWKEYKTVVDKTILEIYHQLHQQYGKMRHQITLDDIYEIEWIIISKISFVILPLSTEQISSATKIDEKSETVVSNLPYVAWITLDDYCAQRMWKYDVASKMKCLPIVRVVDKVLCELFNHSKIHWLSPINMKVVSVNNWIMYIVITDLAIRIPEYIESYQQST